MATAADTLKTAQATAKATADTVSAKGQEAFTTGMNQAAAAATAGGAAFKDAADKSLGALNEMNAQSKRNLEAVVASVTAATKGAEAIGAQAMAYSKTTFEGQVEAAKKMAAAKSVQEAVELQTAFAKTAMEAYMAELTRTSETVQGMMKDAMAPLNERATALMETVQSAR